MALIEFAYGTATRQFPVFDLRPVLRQAHAAVERNLARLHEVGKYILGPQSQELETELAAAFGSAGAAGVSSGTSAIELCLRAAGITHPHQRVIVPSMTSLFTAQAVLAAGASLAVCDVDPDTLLVTRQTLEQGWVEGTAAVIAVHLYGQTCELEEIAGLCRERGAVLIQDACQAHGVQHRGCPLSQFSPYSAYSFYPTKNLGCLGDGGAVVSDDREVLERVRMLRDGGRLGDQVARCVGVNSRLDEMQACYLRAFLPGLAHWNDHRRQLASVYAGELRGLASLKLVRTDPSSVFHLMVVRVKGREEFRMKLAQLGVQTAIHYPVPLHLQPGIAGQCEIRVDPRESELAAEEIVSLPIGPHLSVEDVRLICAHVREVLS